MTGFAAPRVARVSAVLGDGRRRSIAVHALRTLGVDRRAFAFAAGPDTALRRLDALDGAGRRLASADLRIAPGRLHCLSANDRGGFISFGVDLGAIAPEPALPPGPPQVVARDDGVRLCLGVGSLRPDGADCALPPLEPLESRVVRRSTATQTVVAGVVPAAVAAVRVRLSGATVPAAPTATTLPGYAGRYAGSVRFFALTLPGRRRVVGADLLDAGGRVLARFPGPDFPARPPAVALARQGGIALSATRFLGEPCVEVDGGPCLTPVAGELDVAAPCVPRRLVLVAALPARTTGLHVRIADGRTIRARVIRFPARAGLRGRVAVAVLPGAAVPARAIVRRARSAPPAARTLVLPAANRQCGYLGATTLPGVR